MHIRFLTSTPLDIRRGSGTYVGIAVLARALRELGHEVVIETPRAHLPVYTAERLLFNRGLQPSAGFDCTVGFDMDGYRIATEASHVAALKGVIADEVRFERGLTRLTMGIQARCERLHVLRAARVVVTSRYCAAQVRALYGATVAPAIVPELIDLAEWRAALAAGQRSRPRRPVPRPVRGAALPAQARRYFAARRRRAARTHPGTGSAHRGQRAVHGAAPAACRAS